MFLYLVLQWQQIWTFNPFLMLKAFICLTYCRPYLTSRGERDIWSFHFEILKSIQTEMWSVTCFVFNSQMLHNRKKASIGFTHIICYSWDPYLWPLEDTTWTVRVTMGANTAKLTLFWGLFQIFGMCKTVLTGSYNWRFFPGRCKQRTQHTANGWAIEGLIAVK